MITGLLRDPVRNAGDWEGVQPWPRPLPSGRGPDVADDRPPVEEQAKKKWFAPLKAGIIYYLGTYRKRDT